MGRRRLERLLKAGREQVKETVTNFERLEMKGSCPFDSNRESIYSLQFSLDGKYLMAGYADGCIQALTYKDGKPKVYKELKRKYGELPVMCMRFSRLDHQVVYAASSDGRVYACSLADGSTRVVTEERVAGAPGEHAKYNEINGMDFNDPGDAFVTGGRDLYVRLYDVETSNMITKWQGYSMKTATNDTKSHVQRIFCIKYSPEDKHLFLSGGWDNTVKVWDSRLKNAVIKMFSGPHICGDSIDIEGHKVLTGSWVQHESLKIWDLRYNKVLQSLPFHVTESERKSPMDDVGEYVYCAQFADRNNIIAGGSGTHSIEAISVSDNKVIGELKLHGETSEYLHHAKERSAPPAHVKDNIVQALDSTEGGRYIAFGGSCQELKLAALEGGSERELTEEELHPTD